MLKLVNYLNGVNEEIFLKRFEVIKYWIKLAFWIIEDY